MKKRSENRLAVPHRFFVFFLLCICCIYTAYTQELTVGTPFGSNMVLQRDARIRISGTAVPGRTVTVCFGAQSDKARSASDGRWQAYLEPMPSDTTGNLLLIFDGQDSLRLENVVVGDVWLAGGQSNMTFRTVSLRPNAYTRLQRKASPLIRSYNVGRIVEGGRLINEKDTPWTLFSPESIGKWSAVATYFAAEISKRYGIPIGILHCSHGASTVESWISPEYYAAHPETAALQCPAKPETDVMHHLTNASQLYTSMLAKIIEFPLRGIIWYQGESNCTWPDHYYESFSALIDCWREIRQQPELPFLFAQLSCYDRKDVRGNTTWAELREAQRKVSYSVPRTAMIVTCDAGEFRDIHPKDKQTVGHRFALAARNIVYGEQVNASGPVLRGARFGNGRVSIRFRTKGALTAHGSLSGFELCGADDICFPAQAVMRRKRIILRCDSVKRPQAARYAWRNANTLCLYDRDGLPASPFRITAEH